MDRITPLAKALADETRVRLLQVVSSEGTVCCGDLARALCVSQATISHHVKILTDVRLVETTREGQFTRVRSCSEGLDALRRALSAFGAGAAPRGRAQEASAGCSAPRPQTNGAADPRVSDGGAA